MKKDKQSLRSDDLKSKTFIGTVVSLKMQGTAVVEVERKVTHPLYKKILKRSKRFKVDTNSLDLSLGDKVKIIETKPYSKDKYFKVFVPQDKRKIERKLNGSA